jgi:hypothetical protein
MNHCLKIGYLLICLMLGSCGSDKPPSNCAGTIPTMAHVQLEMSMQMLRMEVSRDEVEDKGSEALTNCDPQSAAPVYESVRADLGRLVACARNDGQRRALQSIGDNWQQLKDRHDSVWRDSMNNSSLEPKQRCIRASAVAGSRVEIERNWEKVWIQTADQ